MTTKQQIKQHIQNLGEEKQNKFKASEITALLQTTSRQYVTEVLREMVGGGEILREGGGRYTTYILPKYAERLANIVKKRLYNRSLSEYQILDMMKGKANFLKHLKNNVSRIFDYAFTEMVNNAIEHSNSENIEVSVYKSGNNLVFEVNDFGVGVFRNVMKNKKLLSELEAMQEILKGKTTTLPDNHSGEGIFFTSKVSDVFILESYDFRLRVDNLIDDIFYEQHSSKKVGTRVTFIIDLDSERATEGIFFQYQTDPDVGDFDKTEIRVKLFVGGTIYVSRSQARRIMDGLAGKFKTIILDYNHVPTVGQAFADEVYRVFQARHPDIEIKSINTNEVVAFMINRVAAPQNISQP